MNSKQEPEVLLILAGKQFERDGLRSFTYEYHDPRSDKVLWRIRFQRVSSNDEYPRPDEDGAL